MRPQSEEQQKILTFNVDQATNSFQTAHRQAATVAHCERERQREKKREREVANLKWNYLNILWLNFGYKVRNDGVDIKKLTLMAPIKRNYVCSRACHKHKNDRHRERERERD